MLLCIYGNHHYSIYVHITLCLYMDNVRTKKTCSDLQGVFNLVPLYTCMWLLHRLVKTFEARRVALEVQIH